MASVIVLGAGVVGLATAIMLANDGHDVTVLERDGEPLPASPEQAWGSWERPGVAQFRQGHYLHPGGRALLDVRLPGVTDALLRAGGVPLDLLSLIPPFIADRGRREGDERFLTVLVRRPVLELAVATIAQDVADIRRGVWATGLLTGPPAARGIPHVVGVRASDGERLTGDVVVDAMGRRSVAPDWLESIGARRPLEHSEDSGFTYYTRFFESEAGAPATRAGLLSHFDSFSLLTLPGDARTWSVTVVISSRDTALKQLREPHHWRALVAACPFQAHWLEGDPITDVVAMSGIADRYRRFVLDGAPVATGMVSVGDSWSCTNPSLGRGITMGLMHAAGTVDVIRDHLADPLALALAHDDMTEARVTPWYRDTIEIDRARLAEVNASIAGRTPPERPGSETNMSDALSNAMLYDAEAFRAFLDITSMLALPRDVLARPGLAERVVEIDREHPPFRLPGPSRTELLRMLAESVDASPPPRATG